MAQINRNGSCETEKKTRNFEEMISSLGCQEMCIKIFSFIHLLHILLKLFKFISLYHCWAVTRRGKKNSYVKKKRNKTRKKMVQSLEKPESGRKWKCVLFTSSTNIASSEISLKNGSFFSVLTFQVMCCQWCCRFLLWNRNTSPAIQFVFVFSLSLVREIDINVQIYVC